MKIKKVGHLIWMYAIVPFFVSAYPYRAQLLRKADKNVRGPRSIIVVYDYHPQHPLDQQYRALLQSWCIKNSQAHMGSCVVEDLHSANMFGNAGDQRYALVPKGGLLAGIAQELLSLGADVRNIEYRYTRVMGCAQALSNLDMDPHLFPAAVHLSIADILQEASRTADLLLSTATDTKILTRIMPRIRAGLRNLVAYMKDTPEKSLADCVALYYGKGRACYLQQLLTIDKQLLESCLLWAALSGKQVARMLVIAGGTHCAALVTDLLEYGYTSETLLQDTSALHCTKPQALSPDDLQYILRM